MRERPILFQGAMVRAILDGSKTQTRRPLYVLTKNIDRACFDRRYPPSYGDGEWPNVPLNHAWTLSSWRHAQLGDRLWVREAWRVGAKFDRTKPSDIPERSCSVLYGAGGSAANTSDGWRLDDAWPGDCPVPWAGKLRPSMFMPRWASRITLEITGMHVERLQDISEADAKAEGVDEWARGAMSFDGQCNYPADEKFRLLWESINGRESWAADPWVWAVEFRRLP